MSLPVLATKLFVPPTRANAVTRSQEVGRLRDGLEGPGSIALVSAPAGFGKTTILSQLATELKADGRALAWISLDQSDSDPRSFWTYIAAACDSVVHGSGASLSESLDSTHLPTGDVAATLLINDLAGHENRVVLVLDDYHEIRDDAIHDGMLFLIELRADDLRFDSQASSSGVEMVREPRSPNRRGDPRSGGREF